MVSSESLNISQLHRQIYFEDSKPSQTEESISIRNLNLLEVPNDFNT